jgi:hypothetical protein
MPAVAAHIVHTLEAGRMPVGVRTFRVDSAYHRHVEAGHDRMVSLVQTMLDLHKSLQEANTPPKRETIERQIDATDHQIDTLVYDLYGLTPAEIAIVARSGDGR